MARLFDLPETKGQFQLRGIVSGTESDRFFTERQVKNNKMMRIVNFGVDYNFDNRLYVNITGLEQDNVYFYNKDKKDTKKIPWGNRFNFNSEGYNLIGMNVGVKKKIDPNTGEPVNDKKVLPDYDACEEIHNNLRDGCTVFVRGDLSYRSYINRSGDKVSSINLSARQVSLAKDVDFTDEKFIEKNDFNQVIVFVGIDREMDNDSKPTGRYIVSAKIVTYSTIEDAEFIIKDSKLANMFKKNLKPYNAIKVSGHMIAEAEVDVVQDEDEWGESDAMERIASPVRREFIITGAKGSSVDRDTYTEENIAEAIVAINNNNKAEQVFDNNNNNDDDWGNFTEEDEASAW